MLFWIVISALLSLSVLFGAAGVSDPSHVRIERTEHGAVAAEFESASADLAFRVACAGAVCAVYERGSRDVPWSLRDVRHLGM